MSARRKARARGRRRCGVLSFALTIGASAADLFLELQRTGKQNVVLQVYVAVQVAFELRQLRHAGRVSRAAVAGTV